MIDDQNFIIIRTNVDDVLRFIKINKSALKNPLEFCSIGKLYSEFSEINEAKTLSIQSIFQVLSTYGIVLEQGDEFELTDQLNTPIDSEMVEELVLKYEKCCDFVVKFIFKGNAAKMSLMNEVWMR